MSKLIQLDKKQIQRFRTLAIIGDLHGDSEALQAALKITDPLKDGILFLGDYADRGQFGKEVIEIVDSLKKEFTQNVFALKGNHEDYSESGQPEFWPCTLIDEVQKKGNEWQTYFQNTLKPFIQTLPIAAILPGETLLIHGGVSTKIRREEDLINPTRDVELDILWSDPFEGEGERSNWERGGVGVIFGQDVTGKVCKALGVKRIVRSHEPLKALTGPFYSHDERVITVSSTSAYGGTPFLLTINPTEPPDIGFVRLDTQGDLSTDIP